MDLWRTAYGTGAEKEEDWPTDTEKVLCLRLELSHFRATPAPNAKLLLCEDQKTAVIHSVTEDNCYLTSFRDQIFFHEFWYKFIFRWEDNFLDILHPGCFGGFFVQVMSNSMLQTSWNGAGGYRQELTRAWMPRPIVSKMYLLIWAWIISRKI